jgi:uncharacterized protein YndB with AHSA1/START domain
MQKDVLKTWFFQQTPGEVWEYLTRPELIEQWLMKCDFKPIAGQKFQFINKGKIDAYCQVLEVVPPERLSYTWRKGKSENEITVDSVVTWTLTPKNGGTELHLKHDGFTTLQAYTDHNNGWDFCVNRLIEHINSSSNAGTNA